MAQKPENKADKTRNKDDKKARLAENLRANLRRRKSQSRQMSDRVSTPDDGPRRDPD